MTTKADKRRFLLLQDHGCIVCQEHHGEFVPPDIHHIVDGYRLGNQFTLPLCPWHHRGIPPKPLSEAGAEEMFGPSLALNKRAFVAAYGTERELLEITNQSIGENNGN